MFLKLIRSSSSFRTTLCSRRKFSQQYSEGWLDLLGEAHQHNLPLSDFTIHNLDRLCQPIYQLKKDLALAAYLRSLSASPVGGKFAPGGRLEGVHLYLDRECAGPLLQLNEQTLLSYAVDAPVQTKGLFYIQFVLTPPGT